MWLQRGVRPFARHLTSIDSLHSSHSFSSVSRFHFFLNYDQIVAIRSNDSSDQSYGAWGPAVFVCSVCFFFVCVFNSPPSALVPTLPLAPASGLTQKNGRNPFKLVIVRSFPVVLSLSVHRDVTKKK